MVITVCNAEFDPRGVGFASGGTALAKTALQCGSKAVVSALSALDRPTSAGIALRAQVEPNHFLKAARRAAFKK